VDSDEAAELREDVVSTKPMKAVSKATKMTRRNLVGSAALAGIGIATTGWSSRATGAPAGQRRTGIAKPLEEASLSDLQRWMADGRVTSRRLCELYLQRIEALDTGGPRLRSILETNPDALARADQLDREREQKGPRGPLHGIPVVIKDNIATADGMQTTAGSLALVGSRPPRDAHVVRRLREAGAVILGKTNLSEWANFRSTQSSSGWSGRGGQCVNPYARDRSPCGSSSGTGAAVAANLAAIGVGTETDGSVVCPSAACSLVGIKPTVGRIGRSGIIPISHTQDTAGPMARTVADAALLLEAMAGADLRDDATKAASNHPLDLNGAFEPRGLAGARIGVARKALFGYSPEADEVVEDALEAMKAAGAVLIDPADIPHTGELDDPEMVVLLYEFKADLNAYLADLGSKAPVHTLAELIEYNDKHQRQEMPYFGQELFEMAQGKGPLTDKAYRDALDLCRRLSRKEGLDPVFARHRLDAIVAPTGSPPWTIDLINGDHFLGASSTPAAVSGYPSLTVPAGYSFGLPVGVTFIGTAWSEVKLIKLAFAFEQTTNVRKPPRFLPTADLK
jgi:amidase